ncbi:MAG TPA: two-component system sensor histidine kinase CreC [Chthoniobacterales bacterium]
MSLTARILTGFVILALAGVYFLFVPIMNRVQQQYLEAAEEPMVDAAEILAGIVSHELESSGHLPASLAPGLALAASRHLDAHIYHLRKRKVLMDVYLTDARGMVLYDSGHPSLVGADFSKFNDVSRTLAGSYGARATRENESDPRSAIMYVGAPVVVHGKIVGVLSVYKPEGAMGEFISESHHQLIALAFSSIAIFLLVGVVLSRWVTEPLARLTRYAEAVTRGDRPRPVKVPGRQLRILATSIEDMRDALEDRNYVQSYVQTLSHEMKSPVAAIRGAAELLQEEMPAPARSRFVANIGSEAARLQNLIEQLLALASLESRKRLEHPQKIDLSTVVARVTDEVRERGGAVLFRPIPGSWIRGDEFLLETAIRNLIQNALDFSAPGSPVEVSLGPVDDDLTVSVADSGVGIPDYAVDRVFDRFYSLPRPASGRKSSGLGLCFVREVAALHGGRVSLANRTDAQGAIAVLHLPAAS